MKILNWYITRNFLIAFGMSIGILTFCMVGARLVPVLEYVARGVPLAAFGKFILYTMPIVLTFTIPLSVMVSVMLVFGRLSADSEITAMRACGISIMQLVSPIMIITVGLTALCMYLQVQIGPPMLEKSRDLLEDTAIDKPEILFQPGAPMMVEDDTVISVNNTKKIDADHLRLYGVQIFRQEGSMLTDLQAEEGMIIMDREREEFKLLLENARIFHTNTGSNENYYIVPDDNAESNVSLVFNYGKIRSSANISQKIKFMTVKNLLANIRVARMNKNVFRNKTVCEMEVELNERIAFALAPIAFLLLGIPLALHTSRRETSIGLFIGAIAGGIFFLAIILCESLSIYPQIYPQYLLWLPNLLYQAGGAVMVYRITRK